MASRHLLVRRVEHVKRQTSGDAIQAGSTTLEAGSSAPQSAQALEATSASTNSSLYLGIGLGVGGALLIACVLVIVQICRKRSEHKRALAALEQGQTTSEVAQRRDVRGDIPRSVSLARIGRLGSAHGDGGWGALGSNDEINDSNPDNNLSRRKRKSYISLPKRFKQRGIPLGRFKHLSAIIESPRSRSTHSPTSENVDLPALPLSKDRSRNTLAGTKIVERRVLQDDDVFVEPSSPKPSVLPSFAIRSPGRYGASFVEDSPKAKRSYSVGALIGPIPGSTNLGQPVVNGRPPMHTRSISLGAAGQPPAGPVPPLPVIAPHNAQAMGVRNGFCLSRMSTSSQESASSSVLVTSPILRAPDENINSPSLEQMVADDNRAALKAVSHRQWQNPLVAGPRPIPIPDTSPTVPANAMAHRYKASVRSNVARYSNDSQLSRRLSANSVASSLNGEPHNRLSIPRIGTADRVSIRSVSSIGSFHNEDGGIRKVHTPRRVSRCSTTVSESGSPAERPRNSVLRDISGNASTPSRQASNSTQTSSRSSNGNPFQWDSAPLQKPSALKGSPNARKGHRRQNCVRISTLTPQILGPPPSRPTSPSIMHGIEEEPVDFDVPPNTMAGLPIVSHQHRLSNATAFAPHLRISTLRASLTSSSPTLSTCTWTTFQEQGTTFQDHGPYSRPIDPTLSAPASPGTLGSRSASHHSGQSSRYSIPAFPSPSKTTVTAVQRDQPVPEFYFTRPSTDEPTFDFGWGRDEEPALFDLHISDNGDVNAEIPSSPPLPILKEDEYDPACPMLVIPSRDGSREYDPASSAFVDTTTQNSHSSPQTVTFSDDTARYSRPASYSESYQADSPPCSPKSTPQDLSTYSPEEQSASSTPRVPLSSTEKLTSANASTIMARIRTHSRKVDFPGAPILPPPIDDNPVLFPLTTTRNRSASTATYLNLHRPAPPPPLPSNADNHGTEADGTPTSLLPGNGTNGPRAQPPSARSPSPPKPEHSITSNENPKRTSLLPNGPRAAPAKSLARQLVALRRMNSEMDTSSSRESRRYIHGLSREPAPLLPWVGSEHDDEVNESSSSDLFDFDFGARDRHRDVESGAADYRYGGYDVDDDDDDANPTSALDNVDLSEVERRLEGALAGFDVPVSSPAGGSSAGGKTGRGKEVEVGECSSPSPPMKGLDQECDRSSSVWEDGEDFWNSRKRLSTIPGSSPSDAEKARIVQTPRMYSTVHGRRVALSLRSPGMVRTPGSYYDSDGFLKDDGTVRGTLRSVN